MAQCRWLIGIGAVIVVGMLLCGAFSLGIYVGKYGFSAQGIGAASQAGGLPQARPAAGQPDLVGMIRRVAPDSLEVATRQGPRWVDLGADTQFVDERGVALSADDFHPGDLVALFGELHATEGRIFLAHLVVRLPPQAPAQP
jgi:hypothetical protein